MRVVVASPEPHSVAARALAMEGVAHEELLCHGLYGYGELWAALWRAGDPFVLVEWDIAPAPGKVHELCECPEPWCAGAYPLHPGQVTTSMGLGKYTPEGSPPASWARTKWNRLDGELVPFLFGRSVVHIHDNAAAHVRRDEEVA